MNAGDFTLQMPAKLRHEQAMGWLQGLSLPARGQTAVLDASALQSFDSSALACMIELHRRVQAAGVGWRVVGMPDRVQRLAQVYGLAELI